MERDEVLLIKTFDSVDIDTGAPLKTQFHSAFEPAGAPASTPYRRSCEARCLAIFPNAYENSASTAPSARL